jgi:lipopolysaccharide biosynthesis regulator YciM
LSGLNFQRWGRGWLLRQSITKKKGRGGIETAVREALLEALDSNLEAVEEVLGRVLASGSTDPDAYLALARIFRERGEIGRAISVHQTLILRHDLDAGRLLRARAGLAADLHAGGFHAQALSAYREVLALDRSHPEALAGLGALLVESGDWRGALRMLRRKGRVDGKRDLEAEAEVLLAWARGLAAEGRNDAARRLIRRALRRDPKSGAAQLLRAELDLEEGRVSGALDALLAAGRLDPSLIPRVSAHLDGLERSSGMGRDYERQLRSWGKAHPENALGAISLARCLAEQNRVDEAISGLRSLLDREPRNIPALVELGRILLEDSSERGRVDALKGYAELLEMLRPEGRWLGGVQR